MGKKKIAGRPKKEAGKLERVIGFRLSEEETVEFERIFKLSGIGNMTGFIKGCIFNQTVKVVTIDKNSVEFYKLLVNLQSEYRAVGNNYNQAVKAIKAAFSDKKALAFIYRLRDATLELIKINREVIRVTKEFEAKWLQK